MPFVVICISSLDHLSPQLDHSPVHLLPFSGDSGRTYPHREALRVEVEGTLFGERSSVVVPTDMGHASVAEDSGI